jgi:ribosome maturation factor RimP
VVSGGGLAPTFSFEGGVGVDADALLGPVVEGHDLELVEVTMNREAGRRVLRVVVDRDGGIDLDTISEVSEDVCRVLDEADIVSGAYAVEVSSPGIERRLRAPAQFARALGQRVKVRTESSTAGSGSHTGVLRSADDEAIVIATEAGDLRLAHADIVSARTVADWDAELKGSHA